MIAEYANTKLLHEAITDLPALHAWLRGRRESHAASKGVLPEFIIQGNWFADSYGQFMRLTVEPYHEKFDPQTLPVVMTKENFLEHLRTEYGKAVRWSYGFGGMDTVPPYSDSKCACCENGWTLVNMDDVIHEQRSTVVSLAPWVGKPLKVAITEATTSSLDRRTLSCSPYLRNDKYINETPDRYGGATNPRGWVDVEEETHTVEEGDDLLVNVQKFYHRQCYVDMLTRVTRTELLAALNKSKRVVHGLVRVPNEYGSFMYRGPWFLVDTDVGTFRIGWRKRVISVEYLKIPEVADKFELTVVGDMHVNDYDELTSYLSTFEDTRDAKD